MAQNKQQPARPRCITCGRELVFVALRVNTVVFSAWMCDCEKQPQGINSEIVQAREWDQASIVVEVDLEST